MWQDDYISYLHYKNAKRLKELNSKKEKYEFLLGGKCRIIKMPIKVGKNFVDCWLPSFRSIPFAYVKDGVKPIGCDTFEEAKIVGKELRAKWKKELSLIEE